MSFNYQWLKSVVEIAKEAFHGANYDRVLESLRRARYKEIAVKHYIITFFLVTHIRT